MKSYEKYKNTKFPWLNSIPEHWNVDRAKNMYEKQNRGTDESLDTITCFRDGTVTLRKNRRTTGFTESLKEIGYQGICKGDLVIHQMDAFAGAIGVSDSNGKGTPVYSVCIAKGNYNNYYYAYIVREMAKSGYIQSLYRGIRERSSDFRFDVFAKQYLPIPTPMEQEQIVRFLDWKVTMANKFVKTKKKEIALLKEQIEFLCFFDKNTKETSVVRNWGTSFPHYWKQTSAKKIFQERNQKDNYSEELLSVTQEKGVVFKKDCSQKYVCPKDYSNLKLVKKEDFVISLRSFQGGIEYSNIQGLVSPAYNVFYIREKFNIDNLKTFYSFLFKSRPFISLLNSMGGGIRDGKNISYADFSKIVLPIPDEETLSEICKLAKCYNILNNRFPLINDRIQEYKTRLISDVVTGQIDVRGIKIPDYQFEVEEINDDGSETENIETEE